jgi:26S proteasome regulatory subunit N10
LVSPTEEQGKILASFGSVKIGGKSDLTTSVQIAQLALKHRKNKNGSQRIVVFIGGPVVETKEKLVQIGKQLKKNNVAVDVISVGEIDENREKLEEFVNTVNNSDNSHLITVPSGVSPANAVLSSPIMHMGAFAASAAGLDGAGGGGGGAPTGQFGGGGDSNFDMYGGIDPEQDPELAMVMRISQEEARAREEASAAASATTAGAGASDVSADVSGIAGMTPMDTTTNAADSSGIAPVPFGGFDAADDEDEEAQIQQALMLSMAGMTPEEGEGAMDEGGDEDDEDADLAMALALSTSAAPAGSSSGAAAAPFPPAPPTAAAAAVSDADFVNQLLSGVDQSDPLVAAAMAQLGEADKKDESKKEDDQGKK